VTLAQAASELDAVQARITETLPEKIEVRASLVPLQEQITGRAKSGLQLLLAAVAVVLLVGCVNIANLLLSRVTGRRREIAVRAAIGASPLRLVRQVLAETLLVAAVGGAAGVALAFGAVGAIRAAAPVDLPRLDEVTVDGRVLLFTVVLVVAAGVVSGLLPAWRFARADPHDAMMPSSRGAGGSARGARVRGALVAAEVALSALCLAMGGLLLHSFVKLLDVDAGFEHRQVLAVNLELPRQRYPDDAQRIIYIETVLRGLASVPGVTSAGVVNQLPLGGEGGNNLVAPDGYAGPVSDRPLADIRQVNSAYFATIGIPVTGGRVFDEADRNHKVAMLSASAAARLFPKGDAIGRRLMMGDSATADVTITGLVGDVRGVSLDRAPSITVYVPYWQRFHAGPTFVVRPAADAAAVSASVAQVLRQVDPEVPIPAFRSMDEIVAASVSDRRFQLRLVMLFAMAAVLLASLGIYGVVSNSVAQRTGELGIRMALGAAPGRIRGLVLGQSLRPVLIGLAIGLASAAASGRLVSGLLFAVSPFDPATYAGVGATLTAVALVASYAPARRATRVDPVVALRDE
jgi:putative ABC transport system permease protein